MAPICSENVDNQHFPDISCIGAATTICNPRSPGTTPSQCVRVMCQELPGGPALVRGNEEEVHASHRAAPLQLSPTQGHQRLGCALCSCVGWGWGTQPQGQKPVVGVAGPLIE
jgi:hypothetical protein